MQLRVFRSLWGLEKAIATPAGLTSTLKSIQSSGLYAGVELSLGDACLPFDSTGRITAKSLKEFAAAAKDSDLELIIGVYSSWQDYGAGGWEALTVQQHMDNIRKQVDMVAESGLKPRLLNAHRYHDASFV